MEYSWQPLQDESGWIYLDRQISQDELTWRFTLPLRREVGYGQTEIWHLKNRKFGGTAGMLHPLHIHLVNFQILERNGGAPMPWERGWKGTVPIDKGEEVKVIMRFEGLSGALFDSLPQSGTRGPRHDGSI